MAVMVMRGLIFHLVVFSVWVRGMDSLNFSLIVVLGNLLWKYVNSLLCMVFSGVGATGGWLCIGAYVEDTYVRA